MAIANPVPEPENPAPGPENSVPEPENSVPEPENSVPGPENPVPGQLCFGQLKVYKGLSVLPIIGGGAVNTPDYLTLDDALEENLVRITEVNDKGIVPELRFESRADKPVLLVDGEELIGAKQNRVLNLTILVPVAADLVIPVSCVEAGRWSYASRGFKSSEHTQFAQGRSSKMASVTASLGLRGTHQSNQAEVWSEIDNKFFRLGASSTTAAMSQ